MGDGPGRVVLVTGGNRGIGRAVATAFAAGGDRVAVTSRTGPVGGLFSVPCDITDGGSVDSAVGAVEAELGPVEVLVANAGVTDDKLLLQMDEESFTVNVVAPGFIETDMTARLGPERQADILAQVPLRRLGAVEEVAGVVHWLASDSAAYVTGAVVPVDGGLGMGH